MIFIDNKYTQWYYNIVNSAKVRTLPNDTYVERHHIIPKSLGGSNDSHNLVQLTAREHYICHRLLVKMLRGVGRTKMTYALIRISQSPYGDRKITSRDVAYIKSLPRQHTEETKRKISKATSGENNPMYGRDAWSKGKTAETDPIIAKIAQKNKGKTAWNKGVPHSIEARAKMSASRKGRTLSDEHKRKLSEGKKGPKNPNFGKAPWNKKS